ncbi:hypothetical protein [Hydromonas duriensis]|uniref:hypothetical protein n=1 Tax=Hydromonas duriensis TaxID=1527608 RepID=UPI00105E7337|nr:hypothetical protein [Hydromonas duriensis]
MRICCIPPEKLIAVSNTVPVYVDFDLKGYTKNASNNGAEVEREYQKSKEKISSITPIPQAYWLNRQRQALLELKDRHKLSLAFLKAHTHPEVLYDAPYAKQCAIYIDALNSNNESELLAAWQGKH